MENYYTYLHTYCPSICILCDKHILDLAVLPHTHLVHNLMRLCLGQNILQWLASKTVLCLLGNYHTGYGYQRKNEFAKTTDIQKGE